MRILFVCAGSEPGADGVGDYSRRLAGEITRRGGHPSAVIALNDRQLAEGSIASEGELRLSANGSWKTRLDAARKFADDFHPDVLSLQFVSYGFDPRGLPLGLSTKLRTLAAGVPWHIMFHELWIKPKGAWTRRVLSRLQKAHIIYLHRSLRPKVVHTSNENYVHCLADAGISACVLPLFSNIEKAPSERLLRQKIVEECTPATPASNAWIFLFFGTIHPGWDVDVFLKRISHAACKAGKKAVILLSIGKNPCQEHASLSSLRKIKTGFLHFREIGEMPTSEISHYLQAADFGVATTPLGLLGKSGSAAAMASHGIPVVVPRIDIRLDRETLDQKGILPVDEFFEEKLLNPPRPRKFDSVAEIAQLFLKTLDPNFAVR